MTRSYLPRNHALRDKRLRWFDDGAVLLRKVADQMGIGAALPTEEHWYACPLCLVAHPRAAVLAGVLTEEHVPPRALGGRGLLLTCATCNNSAGTDLDAHALRRQHLEDFARGRTTGQTLPVVFHANGIPMRGTAQWTDGVLQIFGVRKQNNPTVQAAHFQALDDYVDRADLNPGITFTIHAAFDVKRDQLSWIRAAYLATFAALGWHYVLRPVMDPYRNQFRQPDATILPIRVLRDRTAPPDRRRILLIEKPHDLRGVAVALGERTVILPGVMHPQTCQQLTRALDKYQANHPDLRLNLDGKEAPWPRRPTYLLDIPDQQATTDRNPTS